MHGHSHGLDSYPDFDPSYRQLADRRGVSKFDVTSSTMREHSRFNPWNEESRRALVADQDEVYGMMRMFEMLMDRELGEIRVFRKMSEALDWLGLDAIE